MEDTKSRWKSTGFIGGVLAAIAGAAGLVVEGVQMLASPEIGALVIEHGSSVQAAAEGGDWTAILVSVATLVAGVVSARGRLTADKRLE